MANAPTSPDREAAASPRTGNRVLHLALQTRPHSSLDVFFRLESGRDRFRGEDNRPIGHQGKRTWSGTGQIYPGRFLSRLTPLSFRVEGQRT